MKQPNINALSVYFADKPDKLVVLRYTFSMKDEEGKEKIYCEIVCGDLAKHQKFLENLADKAVRGYVQYSHEFDTALLYDSVKEIFLLEEEKENGGE